jgi:cell division protein FtsB
MWGMDASFLNINPSNLIAIPTNELALSLGVAKFFKWLIGRLWKQNFDFKTHVILLRLKQYGFKRSMNYTEIKKTVSDLAQEIESIADERIKSIQKTLLNLFELVMADNEKLRSENQKLKDEINRLKGEQGTPSIRKQSSINHSSEKDRKPRGQQQEKKKKSKKKKHKIKINRMEICDIDQSQLPPDVKFKGYQSVVVQDILIQTNNIQFKKKVYYSPLLKKTFIADLPSGYQGEFGPRLKALVLDLHQTHKMTESAIHAFLSNHEIIISPATIARMLVDSDCGCWTIIEPSSANG